MNPIPHIVLFDDHRSHRKLMDTAIAMLAAQGIHATAADLEAVLPAPKPPSTEEIIQSLAFNIPQQPLPLPPKNFFNASAYDRAHPNQPFWRRFQKPNRKRHHGKPS